MLFAVYTPRKLRRYDNVWLCWSAWLSQLAPTSTVTYRSIIVDFCRFLNLTPGTSQAADRIKQITSIESLGYLAALKKRTGEVPRNLKGEPGLTATLSSATIRKHIMCLRRAFSVLSAHKLFDGVNPFDPMIIRPPKADSSRKRDTAMLPFDAVLKVLRYGSDSGKGLRDRALLALMFGAGLRRGECVKLLVGDVECTDGGTWFVYLRATKSGEDRKQALPDWVADRVCKLLDLRTKQKARKSSPLFNRYVGRGGRLPLDKPMSPSGVYKMFLAACAASGLTGSYTPHSARATAITKLLSDGMPHREVQEFSRHKSISMVEHYDKRRWEVDRSPAKKLGY